jgi:hypothetical protein
MGFVILTVREGMNAAHGLAKDVIIHVVRT